MSKMVSKHIGWEAFYKYAPNVLNELILNNGFKTNSGGYLAPRPGIGGDCSDGMTCADGRNCDGSDHCVPLPAEGVVGDYCPTESCLRDELKRLAETDLVDCVRVVARPSWAEMVTD